MILSGLQIIKFRDAKRLVIEPFDSQYVEPNSYAFHLGELIISYEEEVVDVNNMHHPRTTKIFIPETGMVLHPGKFYLGHTVEKIGGLDVTSELFANLSTAAMGMWVQTSAPLGHVGAVIRWTLEICVAQKVRVYPRMRLGKICFWENMGDISPYRGRYSESNSVVASRISMDAR